MSNFHRLGGAALALSLAVLPIAATDARADRAAGAAQIDFSATSTLHDFAGTATATPFAIASQPDGTWSGDVLVPVASLATGIARRDAELRDMFDAANHPQLRARFQSVDPKQVRSTNELPFALRIRDVEQPVLATISKWQQDERSASFDASFAVSLAAFELAAPRVLFVRVGDTVRVVVHVTLERE